MSAKRDRLRTTRIDVGRMELEIEPGSFRIVMHGRHKTVGGVSERQRVEVSLNNHNLRQLHELVWKCVQHREAEARSLREHVEAEPPRGAT